MAVLLLDSLNEDMKGHPLLELSIDRDGKAIGGGKLNPGFSAELDGGHRVLFKGLQRWSEIDFSRRTYTRQMLIGLAVAALGLVIWPLAAWRGW